MNPRSTGKGRVVFGVIGDDIHVVANRILAIGLREAGFSGYNLKTHNTPEDFVEAALEVGADAVLVSSLNGEGGRWCRGFGKLFEDAAMPDVVLYAGGTLVVGDHSPAEVNDLFMSYGFDRVFYQRADFTEVFRLLEQDISDRRGRKAAGTVRSSTA